ncbi:MAG: uracil-DNA glycosylase [Desulfobacterales bacterium]|jgi:DNA polymerase|nr:uracil-DNA glycosylase [Desulfobacterales bacterium]
MLDARRFAQTIDESIRALRQLAAAGVGGVDCSAQVLEILSGWGRRPAPAPESLEAIRAEIGDCRRCELCRSRTRIVFGQGRPDARLMFIGEGPGQEEDRAGEPFVGAAGQLLTRIIQAMNLTRAEVYIANVVKCRPPGNRLPEPAEIATCLPFLERQIAAVRPHLICLLGACAAQSLLGTGEPISRLRGRFFEVKGVRVMPTFHPAFLLRNPERKREVWEDMKLLMKEYPYER